MMPNEKSEAIRYTQAYATSTGLFMDKKHHYWGLSTA